MTNQNITQALIDAVNKLVELQEQVLANETANNRVKDKKLEELVRIEKSQNARSRRVQNIREASVLKFFERDRDKFGKVFSKDVFGQKTLKDFATNFRRKLDEAVTANYFRDKRGLNSKHAQRAATRLINTTGSGVGIITNLTKALGSIGLVINGVILAFQALQHTIGERNKYYKSAITFSNTGAGFTNTKDLFSESTAILQATRNVVKLGAFAGNEKFVAGFRTLLESGTLAKTSVDSLLDSYKFVASQGILLGNTFEETAQDISQIASIYNLKATGTNSIESYKYVSRAIELGMQKGLTKSNIINYLVQYSKSTATSSTGFTTVLGDLLTSIKVIESTSGQQRQQYMSALQSLTANKIPFTSYLGLVNRGQRYSKAAFNGTNGVIQKYWKASALQSNVEAFEYLSRTKGLGDELTMQLGPQLGLFQGLDNEIGLDVMQKLVKNKAKFQAFMNLKDTSASGQVKWLTENFGFNESQRNKLEHAAQLSEALANPMQTIINILQTMIRYIATIATSKIFGNVVSLDTAMLKQDSRVQRYMQEIDNQ